MKDSLDNIPLFSDYSESDNEESAGAANPTIVPWVDPYFFHIVHSVCFFLPAACYKVVRLLKILYYEPYLIYLYIFQCCFTYRTLRTRTFLHADLCSVIITYRLKLMARSI